MNSLGCGCDGSEQPTSQPCQPGRREGWMMVGWLDGWMDAILSLSCTSLRDICLSAGANQTFSLPPLMSSAQNFECFLSPRRKEMNILGDFLALSALSTQDVANCTHPRHSAFHGVMFNFSASFSPPTPLSTSSPSPSMPEAPSPSSQHPQASLHDDP